VRASTGFASTHLAQIKQLLWACLDHFAKTQNFPVVKESYQFEVLNKVYLQNFLHGWVVNRETNLMSLLNPYFATVMLQ
jgi:hypothetical protein